MCFPDGKDVRPKSTLFIPERAVPYGSDLMLSQAAAKAARNGITLEAPDRSANSSPAFGSQGSVSSEGVPPFMTGSGKAGSFAQEAGHNTQWVWGSGNFAPKPGDSANWSLESGNSAFKSGGDSGQRYQGGPGGEDFGNFAQNPSGYSNWVSFLPEQYDGQRVQDLSGVPRSGDKFSSASPALGRRAVVKSTPLNYNAFTSSATLPEPRSFKLHNAPPISQSSKRALENDEPTGVRFYPLAMCSGLYKERLR